MTPTVSRSPRLRRCQRQPTHLSAIRAVCRDGDAMRWQGVAAQVAPETAARRLDATATHGERRGSGR